MVNEIMMLIEKSKTEIKELKKEIEFTQNQFTKIDNNIRNINNQITNLNTDLKVNINRIENKFELLSMHFNIANKNNNEIVNIAKNDNGTKNNA